MTQEAHCIILKYVTFLLPNIFNSIVLVGSCECHITLPFYLLSDPTHTERYILEGVTACIWIKIDETSLPLEEY